MKEKRKGKSYENVKSVFKTGGSSHHNVVWQSSLLQIICLFPCLSLAWTRQWDTASDNGSSERTGPNACKPCAKGRFWPGAIRKTGNRQRATGNWGNVRIQNVVTSVAQLAHFQPMGVVCKERLKRLGPVAWAVWGSRWENFVRWTGKLEQRTRAGRQAEEAEEESEGGMTENNQRHVHGLSKETQHVYGLEKWKPWRELPHWLWSDSSSSSSGSGSRSSRCHFQTNTPLSALPPVCTQLVSSVTAHTVYWHPKEDEEKKEEKVGNSSKLVSLYSFRPAPSILLLLFFFFFFFLACAWYLPLKTAGSCENLRDYLASGSVSDVAPLLDWVMAKFFFPGQKKCLIRPSHLTCLPAQSFPAFLPSCLSCSHGQSPI